jgi:membrane-bound lytic murein transglycosylase D
MNLIKYHIAALLIFGTLNLSAQYNDVDTIYDSYEYVPDVVEYTVQARLAAIENEIPLTFNNKVLGFINYFVIKDRAYTKGVAKLQSRYFPLIEKYLEEYGLPDELKYLAIVESGLNPVAQSRAGAVGLWQFMPLTGRLDYDLYENWYNDDKMDFEKSTIAACRYLSFLYNYFDEDWHLALAAYNTGPGNIRKAIRRSGYKKSFWEIYPYLYRETRSYVPQFIAITYAMNFMEEHNMFLDEMDYLPEYDTIQVSQFLNLKLFAEHTGICHPTLEMLNPAIKKGALSTHSKKYALRIPKQQKEIIDANRNEILAIAEQGAEHWDKLARNEAGSTYGRQKLKYTVKSGDVLGKIANTYNVRIADIRSWNNLRSNTIRIGQRLDIWIADGFYDEVNKSIEEYTNKSKVYKAENGYYKVQPGDTLWDISRKFEGLTVEKLKKLNNLEGNAIKPGQKLKVS